MPVSIFLVHCGGKDVFYRPFSLFYHVYVNNLVLDIKNLSVGITAGKLNFFTIHVSLIC